MATTKKEASSEIIINEIERGQVRVRVVGRSPLIHNRISEKAKNELLLPKRKMTTSDKATSLKHNPLEEFRASPYRFRDERETAIFMPAGCFKGAIKSTALDIPGASKSQIGRLTYIVEQDIAVYGVPEMYMAIVRSADMNRTPDVRTRAVMREWCAEFTISYMKPNLTERSVLNLLAAAGEICGVGDYRPGKGAGAFGRFELVGGDSKEFARIAKAGGRKAQLAALERPEFYDPDSEELYGWFVDEIDSRGRTKEVVGAKGSAKAAAKETSEA